MSNLFLRLVGSSVVTFSLLLSFSLHAKAASADADKPKDLTVAARQYEQAGDKLKAAEIYEEIVKGDPAKAAVLATRIAKIYAESGETNKALTWATEVMKTNPDPQAYLAGIYSLLGNQDEARKILEKELGASKDEHRKLVLRWQLADVYEKKSDMKNAAKILNDALVAVKGTADEPAAKARLEKFQEKIRKQSSDAQRK